MYRVDQAILIGCGDCERACPVQAIVLADGVAQIEVLRCVDCGECTKACSEGAVAMMDMVNSPASAVQLATRTEHKHLAPMRVEPAVPSLHTGDTTRAIESRSKSIWPAIGCVVVWGVRELLPEALAAWRAASPNELPSKSTTFNAPIPSRSRSQPRWRRFRGGRT